MIDFSDDFTFMDEGDWYQFEVWERAGHVVGTQRQDMGNEQLQRYPVIFRFMTTFGGFIIVSDDTRITRQLAIDFAKAFALKRVVHYRVDLKGIGR
jgi:hypothetical protein